MFRPTPLKTKRVFAQQRETHRPMLNRQWLLQYYTGALLKEGELCPLKESNERDFSHFAHKVNGWFYIAEWFCLHFNLSSVTFRGARDGEILITGQRTSQEGQIHLKPEVTLGFNFRTTTESLCSPQHVTFTSLFLSHYVPNLLSLLLPFFILFIAPSNTGVLTIHSYKCAVS